MDDVMLPGADLEVLGELGGSDRSTVRRVRRSGGDTVILKEFLDEDEGWLREAAALSILPDAAPAPRVLAERGAGAAPPAVVLSDLGRGASVADVLLGDDPEAAAAMVEAWATAIGTLHRITARSRPAFQNALDARAGGRPVADAQFPAELTAAATSWEVNCAELGVKVPAGALDELSGLSERLGAGTQGALTPADACPDNNVSVPGGLALIDFESAEWRHIAWDVAYLAIPWASCWCSWLMPDTVTELGLEAYAAANRPVDKADLEVAAAGWAFVSGNWFLPKVLTEDPPMKRPGPTRKATILHRLGQAAAVEELPALAELADRVRTELTSRWGDLSVPLAPAFRT